MCQLTDISIVMCERTFKNLWPVMYLYRINEKKTSDANRERTVIKKSWDSKSQIYNLAKLLSSDSQIVNAVLQLFYHDFRIQITNFMAFISLHVNIRSLPIWNKHAGNRIRFMYMIISLSNNSDKGFVKKSDSTGKKNMLLNSCLAVRQEKWRRHWYWLI